MFTAEDARKLRRSNTLLQKSIQESVEYTVEEIKRAIKKGRDYAPIRTVEVSDEKEKIKATQEQILIEMIKYGYKRYPYPIYSDGILQENIYITWVY